MSSYVAPDFNQGNWNAVEWIVIVGALLAFTMAITLGANDVANSFGTSVGSKTLTLFQACLIASIFEFTGAIALGAPVANNIVYSITDQKDYAGAPDLLAFGMMCSLAAAATWVAVATFLELAVSSTHAIISAIIGFALCWNSKSVVWYEKRDKFPFYRGVLPILVSWVTSPLISGILAAIIFLTVRHLVLRTTQSKKRAIIAAPFFVFVTVWINIFLVFLVGSQQHDDNVHTDLGWSAGKCAWVTTFVTIGVTGLIYVIGWALRHNNIDVLARLEQVYRRMMNKPSKDDDDSSNGEEGDPFATKPLETISEVDENCCGRGSQNGIPHTEGSKLWEAARFVQKTATMGMKVDIFQDLDNQDVATQRMHTEGEEFNEDAEDVFKSLQVFSACVLSFAHGANDVANAVAPFAIIWHVFTSWSVMGDIEIKYWTLALGGAGIVVGLVLFGYKVMTTLGVYMIKLSPSRGFSAELATALTVSICSAIGFPVATTHCIVGAEVAVGLCENIRTGLNWRLLMKTITAWVTTVIFAGLLSAGLFCFGSFAPGRSSDTDHYESFVLELFKYNIAQVNISNYANAAILNSSFPVANVSLDLALQNVTQDMTNLYNATLMGRLMLNPVIYDATMSQQLLREHSREAVGYDVHAGNYSMTDAAYPARPLPP